jgi:hypothetical protein
MKLKISYAIILALSLFFFISKTTHADGTIGACGSIDTAGTYTLSSDIGTVGSTSDCLTITVPGVIIDGAGYTVNGNIRGANGITDENNNGTIGVWDFVFIYNKYLLILKLMCFGKGREWIFGN